MNIFETKRLSLRELTTDDADHFYLLNQDPEVVKYTGDLPFGGVQEAIDFLSAYDQYERYGVGRWAVIRKTDHAFLGWCGLKFHPNSKVYDLGFRFYRKYWNQGYASEAALACLNYGFKELNLSEIIGHAMKANIASVKVLEKIGMQFHASSDFEGHEGVLFKIRREDF